VEDSSRIVGWHGSLFACLKKLGRFDIVPWVLVSTKRVDVTFDKKSNWRDVKRGRTKTKEKWQQNNTQIDTSTLQIFTKNSQNYSKK
jgi:hypothetical protein